MQQIYAHTPYRNKKLRPRENKTRKIKKPENQARNNAPVPNYFVSDGIFPAGTIEIRDGRFWAIDVDGAILGHFSTLPSAVRALPMRGVR
jgi:hypothetical protein